MKIYIAAPEPNDLKIKKEVLLSYYDIYISSIPFRKKTFSIIKQAL